MVNQLVIETTVNDGSKEQCPGQAKDELVHILTDFSNVLSVPTSGQPLYLSHAIILSHPGSLCLYYTSSMSLLCPDIHGF